MDFFKKYFNFESFNSASLFLFDSDYVTNYLNYVNEKPVTTVLVPITSALLCYYVYVYVRKFYPICVNCWFCNASFNVAFEDRFEFTCIECDQFNGFKEDGSYSRVIPEQHDQRYNRTIFTEAHNDVQDSKNGLCHKCNIMQEMKVKQLASFTPFEEKNFDKEVEKFKENLEETLKLCSKCNQYIKKVLSLQEQRYHLKSFRINNKIGSHGVSDWPNLCSLCLSATVGLLSSGAENYMANWAYKFVDMSIFYNSAITITRSIGLSCLGGIMCQAYQCLSTMDKLSAVVMLLWSSLFAINNFEILTNYKPKLIFAILIILLSTVAILRNLTKKQKTRQTNFKLESENYNFHATNYCETSNNRSFKNIDESEMMDIDYTKKSPHKRAAKNISAKTVNNLFQGMKLNDINNGKNNVIRPPKLFMQAKREKFTGYPESSRGEYYPSYSMKDDFEFDTQSVYSQPSYRTQCSSLCHQPISPYTYYPPPHFQPNSLNLSHSSNISNTQHNSEWPKMLMYSIPGIILLTLQCYLLYDIKDFMKHK